jgi:hypothetical protein
MITFEELERIGKEVVMAYFKAPSWHSPEGTEQNNENSQDSIPTKI